MNRVVGHDSGDVRYCRWVTEEEFTELYNRLRQHVYRYALARLHAVELAHDVVSETFRIAWEKRDVIKTEAYSATGYVMGIGKFVILRQVHERQRHPLDTYDDVRLDAMVPPSKDLAESVIASHRGRSIHNQLTPSEQRLVGLMTSPDLDPNDIAGVLGLTRNAYAVRVHRVRKRIVELSLRYDGAMDLEGGML